MGRILGIDYGLKRTGLSVTDPYQIIVQGLETQESETVLSFILAYAGREQLDEIVVGYPFVEGAWGDKGFKVRLDRFIAELRKAFPTTKISLHDERNTSVQAREIISQSGRKKNKRQDKKLLDQTSAIVILQEYLGHI
jgi:putative Holliday junction resolvase